MKVLKSEKNRILHTKDYSLFTYSDYKLRVNTISQLKEDIKKKNLNKDMPVMVDENYNILDRRHVFIALKELGLPVYFKVCEVAERLDFMIAKKYNKKATPFDFAVFHSENINYRKLLQFVKDTPFSFMEVFHVVCGLNDRSRSEKWIDFQEGNFNIDEHEEEIKELIRLVKICSEYNIHSSDSSEYLHLSYRPDDIIRKLFDTHKDIINTWISVFSSTEGIIHDVCQLYFDDKIFNNQSLNTGIIRVLRHQGKYDLIFNKLEGLDIDAIRFACDNHQGEYKDIIDLLYTVRIYDNLIKERQLMES